MDDVPDSMDDVLEWNGFHQRVSDKKYIQFDIKHFYITKKKLPKVGLVICQEPFLTVEDDAPDSKDEDLWLSVGNPEKHPFALRIQIFEFLKFS